MRRPARYRELVADVRLIDPAAADYMAGPAKKLRNFGGYHTLGGAFTWVDTPQGHTFWEKIERTLGDMYHG